MAPKERAELLEEGDSQAQGHAATNGTAPLLRTELAQQGWATSERTLRRTLHRLGYRYKRPTFVLGRLDPANAENKSPRRASGSNGGSGRGGVVR